MKCQQPCPARFHIRPSVQQQQHFNIFSLPVCLSVFIHIVKRIFSILHVWHQQFLYNRIIDRRGSAAGRTAFVVTKLSEL